jgi:hypothetical protein
MLFFMLQATDFCVLAGDSMKYFKHAGFLLALLDPFNLAF